MGFRTDVTNRNLSINQLKSNMCRNVKLDMYSFIRIYTVHFKFILSK